MDLGLKDAVVIVQGGSRGMGLAAAERFAAEGAKIGIIGRTQSDLDTAVQKLQALGASDAAGFRADIQNTAEVNTAFQAIGARWHHINSLVNAAGPEIVLGFEDLSDQDWFDSVDIGAFVNVDGGSDFI